MSLFVKYASINQPFHSTEKHYHSPPCCQEFSILIFPMPPPLGDVDHIPRKAGGTCPNTGAIDTDKRGLENKNRHYQDEVITLLSRYLLIP